MNEIRLRFQYHRSSGQLSIQPKYDKQRSQDEDLRSWALDGGLSEPPLAVEFQSPGRERVLIEKKRLEDEIDGMFLNIQDIFRDIQRKELELQKHACTLAPFRRVPPEILRRILAVLAPISLPGNMYILLDLMQVCKLWSEIVSDMPEMWTNIDVDNRSLKQKWLARQVVKWKAAPLDIVYCQKIQCDELLENLLIRSANWRRFVFDPDCASKAQIVKTLMALRQASTLKEMELLDWSRKITDSWAQASDQPPIYLPSLKSLKLWDFQPFPCFLSLPTLTYLDCESVCPDTAAEIYGWAEMMPNLQGIHINNLYFDRYPHSLMMERESQRLMNSPPHFPSLQKLVVDAAIYKVTTWLPLYIAIMAGSPNLSIVHMTTSFARHVKIMGNSLGELPQVRSLTLLVDNDDGEMIGLDTALNLRPFPGIENLALQKRGSTNERAMVRVLDALATGSTSPLCPRVQMLSFHELVDSRVSDVVLSALRHLAESMTESRPSCRLAIHTRGTVLIRDATVVQFSDFLDKYSHLD